MTTTSEFINNLERLGKLYQSKLLSDNEYVRCKTAMIEKFETPIPSDDKELTASVEQPKQLLAEASSQQDDENENENLNNNIMSALSDLGDGSSGTDIFKAIQEANQVHSLIIKGTASNIDNGEMRNLLQKHAALTERRSLTPPM